MDLSLKRIALIFVATILLLAGAGPWIWYTFIAPPELMELEPLQYTDDSSWAALPVASPPAVWTDGWGVDFFMILESAGLEARSAKGLERNEKRARRQAQTYKTQLGSLGAVYAPLYRDAAQGDDTARAFNTYLRTRNLGRGLVIVHDTEVPELVSLRLSQDPALRERFGGFLQLSHASSTDESKDAVNEDGAQSVCGGFVFPQNDCHTVLGVHKTNGTYSIAGDSFPGDHPITGFQQYLADNVGMMAEPFGEFEEVEIIDIRRPGDTDENRARDGRN